MPLGMKHNIASINAINHLAKAQNELSDSLKRLSSGQRVNSGADDPSGLILSEGLRAQVASAQQALQNSEFSLSLVQTAEGALVEVNNLLIEMRQLATTAANEGATDYNALLALQFQIRKAIEGIDRVSRFTRFGNKTLLDGSHGVTGMGGNEELVFLKASSKTVASPVSGYDVDITELPLRATLTADIDDDDASGLQITLEEEDGAVIRVSNPEGATAVGFAKRLQKAVLEANMNLNIRFDADDEELTIEHREYGLTKGFTVTGTKDDVIVDNAFEPELLLGRDIEGTINDEPADGDGLILTGDYNNEKTSGLSVAFLGNGTGNDIFNWYANQIDPWNFFVCDNIYNRICCCVACFQLSNNRFGSCFNFNCRINSRCTLRTKNRTKTARILIKNFTGATYAGGRSFNGLRYFFQKRNTEYSNPNGEDCRNK